MAHVTVASDLFFFLNKITDVLVLCNVGALIPRAFVI